MEKITVEQIYELLKVVADPAGGMDLEVIAHLLDVAINGEPDKRDSAISSLNSIMGTRPTIN